jgi:hypothetical protein
MNDSRSSIAATRCAGPCFKYLYQRILCVRTYPNRVVFPTEYILLWFECGHIFVTQPSAVIWYDLITPSPVWGAAVQSHLRQPRYPAMQRPLANPEQRGSAFPYRTMIMLAVCKSVERPPARPDQHRAMGRALYPTFAATHGLCVTDVHQEAAALHVPKKISTCVSCGVVAW